MSTDGSGERGEPAYLRVARAPLLGDFEPDLGFTGPRLAPCDPKKPALGLLDAFDGRAAVPRPSSGGAGLLPACARNPSSLVDGAVGPTATNFFALVYWRAAGSGKGQARRDPGRRNRESFASGLAREAEEVSL